MEPEGLSPHLQQPAICPYPQAHHIPRRSILRLSSHLRLVIESGLLPSVFRTKTLYAPLLSPHTCCMSCTSQSFWFDYPNNRRNKRTDNKFQYSLLSGAFCTPLVRSLSTSSSYPRKASAFGTYLKFLGNTRREEHTAEDNRRVIASRPPLDSSLTRQPCFASIS
jgi:hypothetical protein